MQIVQYYYMIDNQWWSWLRILAGAEHACFSSADARSPSASPQPRPHPWLLSIICSLASLRPTFPPIPPPLEQSARPCCTWIETASVPHSSDPIADRLGQLQLQREERRVIGRWGLGFQRRQRAAPWWRHECQRPSERRQGAE